jgi:hypothetical protein
VKVSRLKIINELKKLDYKMLCDFLMENKDVPLELMPRMNFESIIIQPLKLTVNEKGYLISTEILFQEPIGLDVFEGLSIGNELKRCFKVNHRNIKISLNPQKESQLENSINKIVKLLERLVNYAADFLNQPIEKSFKINAELLDQQFENILKKKELLERGETPEPYATIHAKNWRDAKERAKNQAPLYLERDKAYLYEDKKVYTLIPRDLARKLLMLGSSVMLPEDSFNEKEKAILEKLCQKRYLKKHKIRDKIYYSNLDEKTRQILIKGLKNARK